MGAPIRYTIRLEAVLTEQQASDLDDLLDDGSIVPTRYDVTPTTVRQGMEPAIALLRDIRASEDVPTYMRAEADQVLDRVFGIQDEDEEKGK